MESKIFIVFLRRPKDKDDQRSDPFWEFGSFGTTGCHKRNLMNINKIKRLENSQLAFVQGGNHELKLLLITPVIKVRNIGKVLEAKWNPIMPFKYSAAPLIINNKGIGDFGSAFVFISNVNRSTYVGQFSSSFRTRTTPLDKDTATKIITIFEKRYKNALSNELITKYWEALPWDIPNPDFNRKKSYNKLKGINCSSKC